MSMRLVDQSQEHRNRGAVYRSLYRVDGKALTLKAICSLYGLTESAASQRIQKARRSKTELTGETFK